MGRASTKGTSTKKEEVTKPRKITTKSFSLRLENPFVPFVFAFLGFYAMLLRATAADAGETRLRPASFDA